MAPTFFRRSVLCLVPLLALSACGSEAQPSGEGPCPERLVIQTDWMPQAEHGGTYQLVDGDGTVDSQTFRYSGPVNKKYAAGGVSEIEIRAGASAISFAPVASELYKSDEIHLGFLGTVEAMRQWVDTPVVGVAKTLDGDPRVLIWDPRRYDIDEPDDLRASAARVHHFPRISFVTWLTQQGWMSPTQSDETYDGSFREWVLAEGGIVQQGYVTNEVWQLENAVEWSDGEPAPVEFALLSDWGFRNYPSMYVVRADRLDELGPCLQQVVPALSRAWVDYLDDPANVIEQIEMINEAYGYWETPVALSRYALDQMEELGLALDSDDGTYCSFDPERIAEMAEIMTEVLTEQGGKLPGQGSLTDVVTNRFCDGAPGRS